MPDHLREPWLSFLAELDAQLDEPVELHCLGGFVIAELYDFTRTTADVDVFHVDADLSARLARLAGRDSALHKRHKVYLDIVTVAAVPEDYEARLLPLYPDGFRQLRISAFEVHDLVLAKLARNIDRDREDLIRLARRPGLRPEVLRQRYQEELRFQLPNPEREDLTLELWLEMIAEVA